MKKRMKNSRGSGEEHEKRNIFSQLISCSFPFKNSFFIKIQYNCLSLIFPYFPFSFSYSQIRSQFLSFQSPLSNTYIRDRLNSTSNYLPKCFVVTYMIDFFSDKMNQCSALISSVRKVDFFAFRIFKAD